MSARFRLYSREELLSQYSQCMGKKEEELVEVIKFLPFTCFVRTKVISQEQVDEWRKREVSKDGVAKQLIASVLERNTLELYLTFSQCMEYLKSSKAKEIFPFIPDLFRVGLHDPLPTNRSIKLTPRLSTSEGGLTVLWIVSDQGFFNGLTGLVEGADHICPQGYVCKKAKTAELYAVCCVDQLRAPGRQFDGLLAGFQPCPEVLVYTGSCQSGSFSESTRTDYVLAAAGSASEYDLSTEALHAIELCRLNDRDVDFMATVVSSVKATRYAEEETSVHCPEAVTLHTAAKKCKIPALAIVKVGSGDSNCKYILRVVQELVKYL